MKNNQATTAKVVLARKPDSETAAKIEAFAKSKGCSEVEYATDGKIIGGIIVYIGDTVYDGSVKNRLDEMKRDVSD